MKFIRNTYLRWPAKGMQLLTGFKAVFLFFILAAASSCKTCNCPAYSYHSGRISERNNPAALETKSIIEPAHNEQEQAFPIMLDPSQT